MVKRKNLSTPVSFSDVFPDFKKPKLDEEMEVEKEEKKPEFFFIFDENEKFEEPIKFEEKKETTYGSFLEKFMTENQMIKGEESENDVKISIIINLFNDYFTLISSDQSKEPITIYLNSETCNFLEEILNGKLLPELLEEIKNFNLHFYDACIYAEVNDMKVENGTKKITKLEPSPDLMIYDIYQFLEQNHPDLSERDKISIIEKILLNTKKICLDPDPMIFQISNTIHYNKNKRSTIRKRKIPNKKSQHSSLIEYIKSNSYKTTSNDMFKQFEEKPKKPTGEFKMPEFLSPIDFLQNTEKVLHNNKPPTKARILKFQSSSDKNKVWKIDILPVNNGKKYDAIFSQDQDCFSRWHLGTKYSSELYIKRLKDMFQHYGKARCTMDQEVDVNYRNQPQNQPSAIPSQTQPQQQTSVQQPQMSNQMHHIQQSQGAHFQVQPISNVPGGSVNPQITPIQTSTNTRISPQSNKPVVSPNPNISVRTTQNPHQPNVQSQRSNQPNFYPRNTQQPQQQSQQQPPLNTRRNLGGAPNNGGGQNINVARDYRFKNPMNFPLNIPQMNQFSRLQMAGKQQQQQQMQQMQQMQQLQQQQQQQQQNSQPYLNPNGQNQ